MNGVDFEDLLSQQGQYFSNVVGTLPMFKTYYLFNQMES